jgi:molybdopterin molybdotransferase
MKIAIVILAAGSSTRLGTPKQWIQWENKSLLRRISEEALDVPNAEVFIVSGDQHLKIVESLSDLPIQVVHNPKYEEGMGCSIAVAAEAVKEFDGCIITACDQPYVGAYLFRKLINEHQKTGKGIVVTGFKTDWGIPVFFHSEHLQELRTMSGQMGAKKLIQDKPFTIFPYELAEVDMDFPIDLDQIPQIMISVEEAKELIASNLLEYKTALVSLKKATMKVLAEDVYSSYDIPSFRQSSVDGFAFRWEDRMNPIKIVGEIAAGTILEAVIGEGECMRVLTGAPLPVGANTVVMQEFTKIENQQLFIQTDDSKSGDNVRAIGSEIIKGALALKQNTKLTPAAIGYLAGMGQTKVQVIVPPKVSIIVTGNELVEVGQEKKFGQVFESNSHQLLAALSQLGISDTRIYHAVDDLEKLENIIKNALMQSDILLMVGGVSVGDYDFVVQAVQNSGIAKVFHKVKQKPGKPFYFGASKTKMVFGLPGNPSSALTCYYLYVEPALEKMMAKSSPRIQKINAVLNQTYSKKKGLTHFLKGKYADGKLVLLDGQESYKLQSYAEANCLIEIPENLDCVEENQVVTIHLLF